jgi:WD40 repeat protein
MRHPRGLLILSMLLAVTWLPGCGGKPTEPMVSSPSPSLAPTGTLSLATSTSVPAGALIPTATSTPASTMTPSRTPILVPRLPVLAGTPVPQPQVPISPDNANKITELALWGKGQANRVAYSPDGKQLAVGTSIGIWLYDAQTLQQLRFINIGDTVSSMSFSPDSTTIFAKTGEATIASWNVTTGERLSQLDVGKSGATVFFLRGKLSAVADGKHIRLWNLESGKLERTLVGHTDEVTSLAFSPDGALLASGARDRTIHLWDVRMGTPLRSLGHADTVFGVVFSSNGSLLASRTQDRTISLWDVRRGILLHTLEGHTSEVTSLAFSPDNTTLASGSVDRTILLWNVETGAHLHALKGHTFYVEDMSFSPNGTVLVSVGDKTAYLWNTETGVPLGTLEFQGGVSGLAVSPNGTLFVSHTYGDKIELWNASTGQIVHTFEGRGSHYILALSASGTILASGESDDPSIRIWDVATGQQLRALGSYIPSVCCVALSPDGRMMASSISGAHWAGVYDVHTGEQALTIYHASEVWSLAFSPDGTRLVSSSTDGTVRLWDAKTGELLHTLNVPRYPWRGFAFSPTSAMVASGGPGGTIWLWNIETGEILRGLEGCTDAVSSLAFSPDGKILVSGAVDRTVCLWNVETGYLLHTLNVPSASSCAVVFLPNSRLLAFGCRDGTVRLWGVPPD